MSPFVTVDNDVVAVGRRRPEAVDAARGEQAARRRSVEQLLRVVVELARAPAARGSPGSGPSAPRRGRRTSSRCTRASVASAGSTRRTPVNAGAGRLGERDAVPVRRAPARAAAAACRSLLLVLARAAAPELGAVLGVERARARAGSSRSETTPTTREASSTCTTGCAYAGAICTAVCWRDVVAPPISSGSVEPAPLHLARDVDHLVERRRDQPREADDVGALLDARCRGSARPAPSRRGRSPRSCCSRARRRRCSCRCRGRRP